MNNQYLLAIMPSAPLSDGIRIIQEEFFLTHHSKAALKNPPHITLIPPFRATENEIEQVVQEIRKRKDLLQTMEINLSGFASFKRNEVIFINVKPDDRLIQLQSVLEKYFC